MPSQPMSEDVQASTMKTVGLRLIPLLMLCYFVAYVDRVNVGFAALTMKADIGLSDAAFGLGAGLFFVAYVMFEIPSNLAMTRFGARAWIARIMVTWGVVGMATAFVSGPMGYYVLRFLLGAAEAGFFPGVILYITQWFPKSYRARIVASFMIAVPFSSFLGSPLSAALLSLDGAMGFSGWQWVFLAESLPAIVLAVLVLRYLPNRPSDATWLRPEQTAWLEQTLADERGAQPDEKHGSVLAGLLHPRVLALALVYAGISATSNSLSLWQPQILKEFGLSNFETGLINMIPFGLGSVFMIVWAIRADRANERVWATALPLLMSATCLILTNFTSSLPITLGLLSLTLIGNFAVKGPFWAFATERMSPAQAAGGIAAINTIAHLGTGGVTWLIGVVRGATGSFPIALLTLVALILAGVVTLLVLGGARIGRRPEMEA